MVTLRQHILAFGLHNVGIANFLPGRTRLDTLELFSEIIIFFHRIVVSKVCGLHPQHLHFIVMISISIRTLTFFWWGAHLLIKAIPMRLKSSSYAQ